MKALWRWLLWIPSERVLRAACVLALIALPCMVWSVFDPTVWPVMIALSLGQAIGTLSFLMYLFVVARDLSLAKRLREGSAANPVEELALKPGESQDEPVANEANNAR